MDCGHFALGKRRVGDGQPLFVVVEVGQAHDGSLGTAHAFIDIIAQAGGDAVKFQTHIAAAESTPDEPFRVEFSYQDASRYDYWKRMEFTGDQWRGLAEHAREKGLEFLSSPFSLEAVDLLDRLSVPAWKIGSGEIANDQLLARLLGSGKPILVSTGMSSVAEIDTIVGRIRKTRTPCLLYQCTSLYPCPPEQVGLQVLQKFRSRYQVPVGLSDHSGSPWFGVAAAALGAASVEVHITMSRESFGPDVSASLTPDDLARMVRGIREVKTSLQTPVDKDAFAVAHTELRSLFGRGIITRESLKKGTRLTEEMLTTKKPANGLPPSSMPELIGRIVRRDLPADYFILREDLQ
jgi:N,N'-diacetyllegionaminate synthase